MDPETQTLRSTYLEFDKLDAWLTKKNESRFLCRFFMFTTKPTQRLKLTFREYFKIFSKLLQMKLAFTSVSYTHLTLPTSDLV